MIIENRKFEDCSVKVERRRVIRNLCILWLIPVALVVSLFVFKSWFILIPVGFFAVVSIVLMAVFTEYSLETMKGWQNS